MTAFKLTFKKGYPFLVLFFVVILLVEGWYFFQNKRIKARLEKSSQPIGQQMPETAKSATSVEHSEQVPVAPDSRTGQINITTSGLEPAVLTAKPHEEIIFVNKTSQALTFKDQGVGDGLPLPAGESLVMVYDTADTLEYEILGLSEPLKGKVIVE